ncbi:MAG: hypothetical protein PHY45_12485 [Rhodocyclaceae bacterium]|nr:hypothetical protein [Rhodocyclaceae bacterium]
MSENLRPAWRLPLLLLGMASLVAGVLGGLARLALDVPALAQARAGGHGALMIAAFFGTVISLERAVALRHRWTYLGPLCAGLGGLAVLVGAPAPMPQWLFLLAGLVLTAGSVTVVVRQPTLFAATLALGALCWTIGNSIWLIGADLVAAVPFWMCFLVLTIAGERLELTRFLPPRRGAQKLFVAVLALIVAGSGMAALGSDLGLRLFAGGLFALAVWLLRYDIARKTVQQSGLTRFIAVCLLAGYAWLAVGGLLGVAGAFDAGHPWRDAALHAVFLGFVFSMVIGHAPIIFPAVMRVKIPYHWAFYLPVLALHVSLLARAAGVLGGLWPLRQAGGIVNALALLLFILTLLANVLRGALLRPAKP